MARDTTVLPQYTAVFYDRIRNLYKKVVHERISRLVRPLEYGRFSRIRSFYERGSLTWVRTIFFIVDRSIYPRSITQVQENGVGNDTN